jgi:hypothetical protein
MKLRKKILNTIVIFLTTFLLGLVVFEISYRYQLFDFYKAELKGLNSKEELSSQKPKILICGDSFSASPDSYVSVVKDSLNAFTVINAAVPGTGIIQHSLFMPRRIKKFKPDIFVYQFYVGNDLFDISHPISSPKLSFSRKAYWWITDRIISLSFLNFRFAGVRYNYYDDAKVNDKPKEKEFFSVEAYSNREKLNYKAEPDLLENTLFLQNGRQDDLEVFEKKFRNMVKDLSPSAKKFFIIVPHQAQVSDFYFKNHKKLGAPFTKNLYEIGFDQYPLYQQLKAVCIESGFIFVDPLTEFRIVDPNVQLYYSNDPHLNRTGSFLLGTILTRYIKQISPNK